MKIRFEEEEEVIDNVVRHFQLDYANEKFYLFEKHFVDTKTLFFYIENNYFFDNDSNDYSDFEVILSDSTKEEIYKNYKEYVRYYDERQNTLTDLCRLREDFVAKANDILKDYDPDTRCKFCDIAGINYDFNDCEE